MSMLLWPWWWTGPAKTVISEIFCGPGSSKCGLAKPFSSEIKTEEFLYSVNSAHL